MLVSPRRGAASSSSWLACLDARVKITLLLASTVVLFAVPSPLVLVVAFFVLIACLRLARVRPGAVVSAAKPVSVILAFTLVANLVACDGSGSIALAGPVGIDVEGGVRGLAAAARIILLLGFSLVVSISTTPSELGDAVVRLLRPLGRFGVPVAQVGSTLSIALRFMPIVAEEFRRIQLAQRARGVRFDEGRLGERIARWASVFTPLIVALFRRADRLADSMAARCYADGSRHRVPPRPLGRRDRAVLCGGLAFCAVLIVSFCVVPALAGIH